MSEDFDEVTRQLEAMHGSDTEKQPAVASTTNAVRCNGCGVLLDDKYSLPTHIKRVHMKVSGSVTLIACPMAPCTYRHLSQEKIFMHINDVHYRKEGDDSHGSTPAASRPTPAPKTGTPAPMLESLLASGSFGQKVPQNDRAGSIKTMQSAIISQNMGKFSSNTSEEPDIVEINEAPVKGEVDKPYRGMKEPTIITIKSDKKLSNHLPESETKQNAASNNEAAIVQKGEIASREGTVVCHKCLKFYKNKQNLATHIKCSHLKMARDSSLSENRCPYCSYEAKKQAKVFFHINETHYKETSGEPAEPSTSKQPVVLNEKAEIPSENVPSTKEAVKRKFEQVTCFKCGKSMPPIGGFALHIKAHLNLKGKDEPLDKCPICNYSGKKVARHVNEEHFKSGTKMEVDDVDEEFPSLALESGEDSEPNTAVTHTAAAAVSSFKLAAKKPPSQAEWRCSIWEEVFNRTLRRNETALDFQQRITK